MTEQRLDENTINRLKETIDIHRTSNKLLIDWKARLIRKCRECLKAKKDKTVAKGNYSNACDCNVQVFLDIIIELLGNGYAKKD